MINEKVAKELNAQLNRELQSSYNYLAMAAYCDNNELGGAASWLKNQALEERAHALKIYDYMVDMNADVAIDGIEKPKADFKDIAEVFQTAYDYEKQVTVDIENLANMSRAEQDQLTLNFLQWFLAEQVEELATAQAIIDDIKKLGTSGIGLFMLDEKLGKRPAE